jgi:2-keto-4-pentenoate hydratase/2-oxohepta-3-ene-1,7-dioic acid hydratase in catechol pathway
VTFKLGTFSIAGCAPFPGLVISQRVLSLQCIARSPSLSRRSLLGHDAIRVLLANWDSDWPVLEEVAEAVKYGRAPDLLTRSAPLQSVTVHAPIPEPRHIYCTEGNYKKTAAGAQNETPVFFVKSQSAVTGPFDPIVLPEDAQQPDWELELGVVIGLTARRVSRERALDYVAGYTVANDITRRERETGMDWVAAKCAPTFLPLGPYLVPAAYVGDPQALRITLELNGNIMQDESTSEMIFGVARLIESLSAIVELQPGDVICTGSPAGNGAHHGRFLRPGDVLQGSITGLGVQRNVCTEESRWGAPPQATAMTGMR